MLRSFMPERICAKCGSIGQYLAGVSKHAVVNYYRCPECFHIWAHDKDGPDSVRRKTLLFRLKQTRKT